MSSSLPKQNESASLLSSINEQSTTHRDVITFPWDHVVNDFEG